MQIGLSRLPSGRVSVLFALVVSLWFTLSCALAQPQEQRVLLINSYHKGYAWTDEQSNAFETTLKKAYPTIYLDVVYLDWKRHPHQQSLENQATLLENRYAAAPPTVVAVTDNMGLIFALKYRERLFPGIPIVFAGVLESEADSIIDGAPQITGVYQSMDPLGTLEMALALGPFTQAYLIRDDTPSSRAFERDIRRAAQVAAPGLEITVTPQLPFTQILARVRELGPDSIILMGSYAANPEGTALPLSHFIIRVTESAPVPVYGFYENQLSSGIVGGSLLSGALSGATQARLVIDLLQGANIDNMPPVGQRTARKVIDFQDAARFGLDLSRQGADVEVINKPFSIFEEYKLLIIATIGLIVFLTFVLVILILNIRQRKAAEIALRKSFAALESSRKEVQKSEQRYKLAVEAARDIIWEWDLKSGIRSFSGRIQELLGFDAETLCSVTEWAKHIHPDDQNAFRRSLDDFLSMKTENYRMEYRIQSKEGHFVWLSSNAKMLCNDAGEPTLVVGTYSDITEAKTHQEHLDFLAYHDSLTALPNRETLRLTVDDHIENAPKDRLALLFIDMDNFKYINDSSGHKVGDQLLIQTADRLKHVTGESGTVARLGGDEFVIVLPGLNDLEIASRHDKLVEVFAKPFEWGDQKFHIGFSTGLALYPDDGGSFDELLQNADTAMYQAKAAGKGGLAKYDLSMSQSAIARIKLHSRLHDAANQGNFVVYYQPQICAETGQLRGAEALIRWKDPELGMIPPDHFIPACEETGLIIPVGEWVLRQACRMVNRLDHLGPAGLTLGVNVSVVQLMQSNFVERALMVMNQEGVAPTRIELEITESVVMGAFDEGCSRLGQLRKAGFQTGLDDFGVGYSSLTYLRQLPFSTLKLDKSFIKGLPDDHTDSAMVGSIIQIAHELGLETVAEGVETMGQKDMLAQSGCTWLQGYAFSRPLPENEFISFVTHWKGFSSCA